MKQIQNYLVLINFIEFHSVEHKKLIIIIPFSGISFLFSFSENPDGILRVLDFWKLIVSNLNTLVGTIYILLTDHSD